MDRPAAVLFDLGGVLVELSGVEPFGALIGETDPDRIWSHWLSCPWVRRHETGDCTVEEFAAGAVEHHGLAIEADRFLEMFRAWPRGLFPGASTLVAEVAARVPTACLSNISAVHWEDLCEAGPLEALFPLRFLSFEIGHVKPDAGAFRHAAAGMEVEPHRILYLDDVGHNVVAARRAGLDAVRAVGLADVRRVLAERGLARGDGES